MLSGPWQNRRPTCLEIAGNAGRLPRGLLRTPVDIACRMANYVQAFVESLDFYWAGFQKHQSVSHGRLL